jgi:hypothetical protein
LLGDKLVERRSTRPTGSSRSVEPVQHLVKLLEKHSIAVLVVVAKSIEVPVFLLEKPR